MMMSMVMSKRWHLCAVSHAVWCFNLEKTLQMINEFSVRWCSSKFIEYFVLVKYYNYRFFIWNAITDVYWFKPHDNKDQEIEAPHHAQRSVTIKWSIDSIVSWQWDTICRNWFFSSLWIKNMLALIYIGWCIFLASSHGMCRTTSSLNHTNVEKKMERKTWK